MHETRDPLNPLAVVPEEPARDLKTTDLGIDGLAPAIHLGAGGSANVFAAKQLDTGEAVAVKLLRASADSDKERNRFEREHETLQRLVTHDGIVPVLEAGLTDREEPYFLMPLMEGSLQDRIDRDGALDWQTATQLVAQVADAVSFAHQQQVLHRDLKPGNILLDGSGVPRVADFGIAKLMDSNVSKSSKSLGTPSFMPPERFNGLEATEESDVYGLGATLVALLTGSAPFLTGENDTDVAVMMRVVTEDPPGLDELDVPEEVRVAVYQAMAKDPADRPATAAAFADQLRMAIEPHVDPAMTGPVTVAIPRRNLVIPDKPITGPAKGWTVEPTPTEEEESRRKGPVLLIAAAAVVLVGLLGFFGVSALSNGTDDLAAGSDVETGESEELSGGLGEDIAGGNAGDLDDADGENDAAYDGTEDGGDDETTAQFVDGDALAGTDDGAVDGAAADGAVDTTSGDADTGSNGDDDGQVGVDTSTGGNDTGGTDTGGTDTGGTDTGGTDTGGTDTGGTDTGGDDEVTVEVQGEVEVAEPPPAKPVACISASRTSVETGDLVQFSNCSTDATSYSWDLDGSSSSSSSASTSWSTAGVRTVTLTARGPGGTDTESVRVTVSNTPPPPAKPSACFNASSSSVDTGQSVSFSNCSSDATSYAWTFGDGSTSTQKSPSKSWSTTGSKTVQLTAKGPGGSHSVSKTITVTKPAAAPKACFSASSTTVKTGQSVTFSNCSLDATSYWWTFGDGSTSSQHSPSKSWSTTGTKTVELTANGPGGSHKTTRTIKVEAVAVTPEACFSSNKSTVTKGSSISFTNCSKNATSYKWNFGDGGSSTDTSPTHTFNTVGSFLVELTATGRGDDTVTRKITVNAPPTGDERVRPTRIKCTTHGPSDWSWTWTTLPAWVNDYIVVFDGGGRASVGKQPASYRTKKKVTAIIAVDKNNIELQSPTPGCDPWVADAPDVPSGVSCSFSNFRWENDLWTWQESWSWSAVPGITYRVVIETNGHPKTHVLGGSSVSTNPSNGQPNSGQSVKAIIAVNADGKTATRNVNPCGNEGGSGWKAPTAK